MKLRALTTFLFSAALSAADNDHIYSDGLTSSGSTDVLDAVRDICVFGGNHRQASLFGEHARAAGREWRGPGRQFLAQHGSRHRFHYHEESKGDADRSTACKGYPPERTLFVMVPARELPLLMEFRVNQTIYGRPVFVVIIEEYCDVPVSLVAQLSRHPGYIGRHYMSSTYGKDALYIPLGPRHELEPLCGDLPPDRAKRPHIWNFVGSLNTERSHGPKTHGGRASLKAAVEGWTPRGNDTFLHITPGWTAQVPSSVNGQVAPAAYQKVLLDSYYTLCPGGHSFETFRFWEAVDAGSIPVLVLQGPIEPYKAALAPRSGICRDPFRRVLDTKPPIVIMEDWAAAMTFLDERRRDPELRLKLAWEQRKLKAWSTRYWRSVARQIDNSLSPGVMTTTEPERRRRGAAAVPNIAPPASGTAAAGPVSTLRCAGNYRQYGSNGTASTLQWYATCSILRLCALRHSKAATDVDCGLTARPNAEGKFATIAKSYADKVNSHNATVLCTSENAVAPSPRCAHVQSLSALVAQGQVAEIHRLAAAFGLDENETGHLQHHLRLWDIVRKCCGFQASQQRHHENAGTYQEHDPANPMCTLYNLAEVEDKLLQTKLGRSFEVLVTAGGRSNPKFKSGYCKLTRDKVAEGVGVDGKPGILST